MTSIRANIITKRTYCRPKNDEGTELETWEDVVDRVIDHQRWLWERALTYKEHPGIPLHDITDDLNEWIKLKPEQILELTELKKLMLERKALPSGRTLWLGGTNIAKNREASMFNCSCSAVETVYDLVDIFWLLLNGCGIGAVPRVGTLNGFRKRIKKLVIIPSTKTIEDGKGRETNEESFIDGVWTISIGDSAEAWAKSLGKLIAGKYKAEILVLDFSEIRSEGVRLKGYGWISSGYKPLSIAYSAIFDLMNNKAGNLLSFMDIVTIINWVGTVLSSRRSAEIIGCPYDSIDWMEFSTFKKNCFEKEYQFKQQSNNSLIFDRKPTREELSHIFDMMIENGGSEPGFINAETARKRAPWFLFVNPCGEILLPNKGFCNLVEVDVGKFIGDTAGLHHAETIIARANYRQTVVDLRDGILQEAWHKNNEFLRLCGVGITGIAKRDDMTEFDWKNLKYSAVCSAKGMAKELGLEYPKNVTTVKPSGTLGKTMDTTEGIHKAEGKYLFNWVTFSGHDPLVQKLKEANYKWLPKPGATDDSVVICLPVVFDNIRFDTKIIERQDGTNEILEVNLESAITQLERYKKIQLYYCDQNVSNTIYYKPEEKDDIIDWILTNWDIYVGISFLYKNDPTVSASDLGYNYLPQEYVTKEKFYEYQNSLLEINWDNSDSNDELEDEGCISGMCPIK